ncbi:MAG TPA: HupE/UreJ family protein [Acidobacteriota bacterium]|jgi:hydrogenase/urease accessory protein HupE
MGVGLRSFRGRARIWLWGVIWAFVFTKSTLAHNVPFSYLDLRLGAGGIEGTLVAHSVDLSYDLAWVTPDELMDRSTAEKWRGEMEKLIRSRLVVGGEGKELQIEIGNMDVLQERQALQFHLRFPWRKVPGTIGLRCMLFPYDPQHQTFVNIYERGRLAHQEILSKARPELMYYTGSTQGHFAVLKKFIPAGIEHILIGPDHVLFIVGLLLLGGGIWRLLKIVTAFTLAHSITLSLAALDIVSPPARLIEPAIALSIVYVGLDNLLIGREGRDARAWIAFFFGFIHGFGFANVLREFGLPRQALGWSLFSFNFGVEIGQALIVVMVALILNVIRSRSHRLARQIVFAGSAGVMLAGAYWFVQRVFFGG